MKSQSCSEISHFSNSAANSLDSEFLRGADIGTKGSDFKQTFDTFYQATSNGGARVEN